MSDVIRIFVEKREGFNVVAKQTLWDIRHNLGMRSVTDLRYIVRYDIEGLTRDEYDKAKGIVLSEPNADVIYEETLPVETGWRVFAMEYLPGQYDQRGDSAEQCVQLLTQGERCKVLTARVIALKGDLTDGPRRSTWKLPFPTTLSALRASSAGTTTRWLSTTARWALP